ncbi:MAG: tripartite tricarboxylate transporter substrate binding protein [Burkholderiaceae bacterium]
MGTLQRRDVLIALGAFGAFGRSFAQAAAAWPTRPVTVIVPFAPGGAGNGSLRILAEVLGPQLGQPLVVENRPGAGGITGTQAVAQSSDDHLLVLGSTTMTILPALRPDLPYNAARDLQPVGMISSQPQVLAVAADSPLKSLDDLVARGKVVGLTAGNAGVGTLSHLTIELLNRKLGLQITAVPYKGDALLIPDVVSGNTSLGVLNLPVALPLLQSGRLRALAVTSARPVAALPGTPLLRSLGDEFIITGWAALLAGKRVPAAGIDRLSALLAAALADPGVRDRFATLGVAPEVAAPAQLREFLRSETARWGDVVKSRNIRLE